MSLADWGKQIQGKLEQQARVATVLGLGGPNRSSPILSLAGPANEAARNNATFRRLQNELITATPERQREIMRILESMVPGSTKVGTFGGKRRRGRGRKANKTRKATKKSSRRGSRRSRH